MALDLKISQPLEFYKKFVKSDVRPDGRSLGEFRQTYIKLNPIESTADGSSMIKVGNTSVICGVKAELFEPQPDDVPDQGTVIPNVELNAGCSSSYRSGPPSEQAQVASQMIADVLTTSNFLDSSSLCVSVGKLAWCLFCDVICLDLDGNLLDACLMAVVAALSVTKLPVVSIDEITKVISVCDEKKPLTLGNMPVSSTFSIFDDGILLADASREEEDLCAEGSINVVTTYESVVLVHKPGGMALHSDQVQTCVDRAFQRTKGTQKLIEDAKRAQL